MKEKISKTDSISTEGLSRRDFVATVAVAGVSVAASSVSWALSTKPVQKNKIKTRMLGKLEVPEMGAGCMSISANLGPAANHEQGIKVIRSAYEKGVRFFDTAEVYGPYTNELLVGEALAPFRKDVFIATKFGFDIKDGKVVGLSSRLQDIKKAVEGSLKRLKTDHIDLYYQHRVDPQVPIEVVAGVMKELIKEGKILNYGLSEASAKTIRKAHAVHPICAVQTEYSFIERTVEKNGVLKACEELGIGFVPWGPLAEGLLTGKINTDTKFDAVADLRSGFDRFTSDNIKANKPIFDLLNKIAQHKKATSSQIALAWLLVQKPFIVPIPGTRSSDHLNENFAALNIQLSAADLSEMELAFAKLKIYGGRMNEAQMKVVDQTV